MYNWDDINIPIKKNSLFTISTKLMITNKKNEFSFLHIFWWNYEAVCGVSTVKTKGVAHRHTHHTCNLQVHTYLYTYYLLRFLENREPFRRVPYTIPTGCIIFHFTHSSSQTTTTAVLFISTYLVLHIFGLLIYG